MGFGIRLSADGAPWWTSNSLEQIGYGKAGALSFDDCTVGIHATQVRLEVSENHMDNMTRGIISEMASPSGNNLSGLSVDIKNNDITASQRGIVVSFAEPKSQKSIANNIATLTNKGRGIEINGMEVPADQTAPMMVEGNEVFVNAASPSWGILVNSEKNVNLLENVIELNNPAAGTITGIGAFNTELGILECNEVSGTTGKTWGIYGFMSPMVTWSCNKVHSLSLGFQFDGGCESEGNFRGNIMEDNDLGLLMRGGSAIDKQSVTGNFWTNTVAPGTLGQARHEGNLFNVLQSPFEALPSSSQTPDPITFLDPDGENLTADDWFDLNTSTPYSCDDPVTQLNKCGFVMFTDDGGTSEGDGDIATGGGTGGDVKEWMSKRYLFGKLQRHPALKVPGSVFETFYNNELGTTVGKFADIDSRIEGLFTIDPVSMSLFRQNQDAASIKLDSLKTVDSLLLTVTGNDSLALLATRATLLDEIDVLSATGQSLLNTIQAQQATEATFIKIDNDAILVTAVYEQNEKTVNDILLGMFLYGNTVPSISEADVLQPIADQCPLVGGDAVFTARSLLTLTGDVTNYDDEVNCAGVGGRSRSAGEKTETVNTFKLFPNPAKDLVTLEWTGDFKSSAEGQLLMFDQRGKQILNREIDLTSQSVSLETSGFSPGLYLFEVRQDGRTLFSEKLVLVK